MVYHHKALFHLGEVYPRKALHHLGEAYLQLALDVRLETICYPVEAAGLFELVLPPDVDDPQGDLKQSYLLLA